jgi:hypothetical protein
MKKIAGLLIAIVFAAGSYSQPFTPAVKNGASFGYTFFLHGQQVAFELTVKDISDTLRLGWNIRGLAGGTYIMLPAARDHATKMNFVQPAPGVATLAPDETFCMISKAAFRDLAKNHRFVYDNTSYILKDDAAAQPVMIDGRPLDLLHVAAADETTELWILNNPDFPLVCKISGNVLGINCLIRSIR